MTAPPLHPTLFARLVDYAGVFPPAELEVTEALKRYSAALDGKRGWMLGPFLLPSSRLVDATDVAELGAVMDGPLPSPCPPLRQVEMKMGPEDVDARVDALSTHTDTVFVEADGDDPVAVVGAVADVRRRGLDARAKIRTGGVTPAATPAVSTLARFITNCVEESVPFKATAGLHHAFHSSSSEAPGHPRHGFVNLLAAVRVALEAGPVEACLADGDPSSFDVASAVWQGHGAHLSDDLVRAIFSGFGSCSFDDPVGELEAAGGIASSGRPR